MARREAGGGSARREAGGGSARREAGGAFEVRDALVLLRGWRGAAGLLRQRSLVEGVWHGRRGWLAVAAVVWGARGAHKAFQRDQKVLLREVLKPGQQLLISEPIVRPTRRQRRRARRTGSQT
jgi:hypothetical protein